LVSFKRSPGVLVGLAGIVFVIFIIQGLGSGPISDLLEQTLADCGNPASAECQAAVESSMSAILVTLVMSVFFTALAGIAKYGIYRATIGMSRDRAPLLADMLPEAHFGTFALFAVIYSIATIIGLGLCIVPGLVVTPFVWHVPFVPALTPHDAEVDEIHWARLGPLLSGAQDTTYPYTWKGLPMRFPGYRVGDSERIVWGMTHRALETLFTRIASAGRG
jgi:hypothetical protein